MKNRLLILIICIVSQSCIYSDDDGLSQSQLPGNYEPVIMNRTDFEASTAYESTSRTIENSGKIYVKGNYIFINEVNKGFHIINNANPSNPNNIGFIKILGSSDLSIKSDVFYVNNATDLVAFTIDENSQTLTISKRLENVFPQLWSPEGFTYYGLQDNEIIVDWVSSNENE